MLRNQGVGADQGPDQENKRVRDLSRSPYRLLKQRIQMMEATLPAVPLLPGNDEKPKMSMDEKLDAVAQKMDWLMNNCALQTDITRMDTNIKEVQADVQILKEKSATRDELTTLIQRVQKLELGGSATGGTSSDEPMHTGPSQEMIKRLETLEKELQAKATDSTRDVIMVVGGLGYYGTLDEAEKYVRTQLWTLYGPAMVDSFAKGDWKGLLFVKFSSKSDRDCAVKIFRDGKYMAGDNKVWAKEDLALDERVLQGALFGSKKIMIQYGYDRKGVWVDLDKKVLMVGSDIVLEAKIENKELKMKIQTGWEEVLCEELTKLVADGTEKLKTATKGLGKGKNKSKGD